MEWDSDDLIIEDEKQWRGYFGPRSHCNRWILCKKRWETVVDARWAEILVVWSDRGMIFSRSFPEIWKWPLELTHFTFGTQSSCSQANVLPGFLWIEILVGGIQECQDKFGITLSDCFAMCEAVESCNAERKKFQCGTPVQWLFSMTCLKYLEGHKVVMQKYFQCCTPVQWLFSMTCWQCLKKTNVQAMNCLSFVHRHCIPAERLLLHDFGAVSEEVDRSDASYSVWEEHHEPILCGIQSEMCRPAIRKESFGTPWYQNFLCRHGCMRNRAHALRQSCILP